MLNSQALQCPHISSHSLQASECFHLFLSLTHNENTQSAPPQLSILFRFLILLENKPSQKNKLACIWQHSLISKNSLCSSITFCLYPTLTPKATASAILFYSPPSRDTNSDPPCSWFDNRLNSDLTCLCWITIHFPKQFFLKSGLMLARETKEVSFIPGSTPCKIFLRGAVTLNVTVHPSRAHGRLSTLLLMLQVDTLSTNLWVLQNGSFKETTHIRKIFLGR